MPSISEANLSQWLLRLKAGDSKVTERLWKLYFEKMVGLARRKLGKANRIARDEEDVALSAFKSFCLGVRAGKYSGGGDEVVELWPLLMTLTLNKAIDHIRHSHRKKRRIEKPSGGGNEQDELIEHLASTEPTPVLLVAAKESIAKLLDDLAKCDDPSLLDLAVWRINGCSVGEIAQTLNCTERTVQRKLKTIRAIWDRTINELY